MTKQEFKAATASAKTWQDGHNIIDSLDHEFLVEYVTALKAAQQFTDLTMRDEFLLRLAENRIARNIDQMQGNISDPPEPLKIGIRRLIERWQVESTYTTDEFVTELEELINQNE